MIRRAPAALAVCLAAAHLRAEQPIEVRVRGEEEGPPHVRREAAVASTVLRGEALRAPGADAADVVSRAPGVQISRTGSSADLATASLRGASSAQLPVYLAGVRLNDDVTGTADLSSVPVWMLERVEVYRGNAPERADRLGLGGAIFLEPRLPKQSRLGGGAGVGSFGELATWVGAEASADRAGAMVMLRRARADDDYPFIDTRGTVSTADDRVVQRPNADSTSYDVWAVGRSPLASGARVTTMLNAFSREQGVTGLALSPALGARAQSDRLLAALSAHAPCASERCRLELSSSALVAKTRITDPLDELSLGAPFSASDGARFVERARLEHELGEVAADSGVLPARIGVGTTLESERLTISRPDARLAAARRAGRLDVTGGLPLSKATELVALVALGCHTTDGPTSDGPTCGVLEPEGRLGARLILARRATGSAVDVELLGNVNRYVRVPALGELYGVSPLVRGNASLAPETGVGVDLGVRAATAGAVVERAWVDAMLFARDARGLVSFRRSGLGFVRPFNVGSARIVGAELALGADALRHLRVAAAVTALDPRDVTDDSGLQNDLLPFVSRLVATEELELYVEPGVVALPLTRASVLARLSHRSSRPADSSGLVIIAEQHVLDLEGALSFWDRRLTTRLAVENLLDAARFDVVGFPLPGRSLHASIEIWLW